MGENRISPERAQQDTGIALSGLGFFSPDSQGVALGWCIAGLWPSLFGSTKVHDTL
jgi:hypothetical protein